MITCNNFKMNCELKISVFLLLLVQCDSARILGVVPTPSYSHQIAFHPLWKELSLRGHQVTVISTDPLKNSSLRNLTEINVHDVGYREWNNRLKGVFEKEHISTHQFFKVIYQAVNNAIKAEVEHPEVQALINDKNAQFDLLLTEFLTPVFAAFAIRFNCPFIGMFSLEPYNYFLEGIGNTHHPALHPDMTLAYNEKLTFLERVESTVQDIVLKFMFHNLIDSWQSLVNENFGNNYPLVNDMIKNMSMIFAVTDPIMFRMRPLMPNTILIGGTNNLLLLKPLPKDLKKYLDDAKEGAIYFSLGTNIKSKDLQQKTLNTLLETFAELPYKVLWKFELEKIPNQPANIYTSKWFPQQDVLRHPNIKLFIMQGGLQSIEEALHSHVPLIGMPFFADQPGNVKRLTVKGIGLAVDHNTLEKEDFKSKIIEVIENPKYKERITELSNLMVDQPMTGLERAVWWTEYVIRHKGAKHFKSPSIDLPLYQYFLLDVIGFCLTVILLTLYILVKIFKLLFKFPKYIFNRQKNKLD